MNTIHPILKAFMEPGDTNVENTKIPKAFVEEMLETNPRLALDKGHRDEREEIICRLLASDMSPNEISLILKLRTDYILEIGTYNGEKIRDYAKKLKARRKSLERTAK
jgi:hypothetical protein